MAIHYIREKKMTQEQITIISKALINTSYYIKDNLDVICDEGYFEETQDLLREVEHAIEILKLADED